MSSVFAPSMFCAVLDQYPDEPVSLFPRYRIFPVKNNANNMVYAAVSTKTTEHEVNIRNSRRPTVKVPMKSRPAS